MSCIRSPSQRWSQTGRLVKYIWGLIETPTKRLLFQRLHEDWATGPLGDRTIRRQTIGRRTTQWQKGRLGDKCKNNWVTMFCSYSYLLFNCRMSNYMYKCYQVNVVIYKVVSTEIHCFVFLIIIEDTEKQLQIHLLSTQSKAYIYTTC